MAYYFGDSQTRKNKRGCYCYSEETPATGGVHNGVSKKANDNQDRASDSVWAGGFIKNVNGTYYFSGKSG